MGEAAKDNEIEVVATNRKALHKYSILEVFEAGLELKGPEVKSVRGKNANLDASYAGVDHEEIYIYNLHIAPYIYNTLDPIDPTRTRKLLLKRKEIKRIMGKMTGRHLTLVPLELYFRRGWAKLRLALASGKAAPDRRDEIKKKDANREIARELRNRNKD